MVAYIHIVLLELLHFITELGTGFFFAESLEKGISNSLIGWKVIRCVPGFPFNGRFGEAMNDRIFLDFYQNYKYDGRIPGLGDSPKLLKLSFRHVRFLGAT